MHRLSFRHFILGLTTLWLLVLFAEGWMLIDGSSEVRAEQRRFAQARREVGRLASLDPPPTETRAASIEKELAVAEDVLACLQAGFADDGRAAARPAGTSDATDCVLGALLAARPAQVLSVQCARPHGSAPRKGPARPQSGDAAAGEGDLFDFDPSLSVREAGVIETVPLRLTFTGRTATLRQFLNQLSTGRQVVAICGIAAGPVATTDASHRGKSTGTEPVALVVQPVLSKFVVTVEFCELALTRAAENGPSPASEMKAEARHPPCAWPGPTPQKRGRGWIYEIFTPPTVFSDRRSHSLAAISAEEAMPGDSGLPPSDLQLLQVRKKPFRLRLVGFAGEQKDLRGIFTDTTTGSAVIGRAGERLAGLRVRLKQLALERADCGAKGTYERVTTATVVNEETGEEVALSTHGPSPAGAPLALFASMKDPAWRCELKEGESVAFDGARLSVERVELDPPLAVVTCAPADGAKATNHVLLAQGVPDSPRSNTALTGSKPGGRDLPTTQ